jgi:APA family basic amino acid/polyamine antiporter
MTTSDRNAERGLLRVMGRFDLTALVINSVIGAGVFGLPAVMAALTGTWSPAAVLFAALGIIPIALCVAEVGSRFDVAGGPYVYAREAFGAQTGFHVGWLLLWTRLLSAGAVLNILTAYLSTLIPWVGTPVGRASTMIAAVALFTAINLRGVRQASWTINLFTIAKLAPLVLLIVVGAIYLRSEVIATQTVAAPKWTDALLQMVFAFAGFEVALVAAGEVRHPRHDAAFALIVAIAIITAVYTLVQLAVIAVLPNAAASNAPIADALGATLGTAGVTIGSLGAAISAYGWLTGNALLVPRLPFSMAERGELPHALARVHPVFRTPHVAILVCSIAALTFGLVGTFAATSTLSAIGRLLVYMVTCGSLIALRKHASKPAGFMLPGGRVFAAAGIVFSIWLLSTRSLTQAWMIAAIMLAGAVARAITKARRPVGPVSPRFAESD